MALTDISSDNIYMFNSYASCNVGDRLLKPEEAGKLRNGLAHVIEGWGLHSLGNGYILEGSGYNNIIVPDEGNTYNAISQSFCANKKGDFFSSNDSSNAKYNQTISIGSLLGVNLFDGVQGLLVTDIVDTATYGNDFVSLIKLLVKVGANGKADFLLRPASLGDTDGNLSSKTSKNSVVNYSYTGISGVVNRNELKLRYNGTGL